ncbi:MAG TPA: tetratricopeptide repeat protein [Cyclobacteriaceae bacterium]|nr:tetratricopeptide repeat protein [Cyclobacteriaceae bacterium]
MRKISNIILAGIACSAILSCSAEKNNFFSRNYHNTTARYNAYFIARLKLKEVESVIEKNHVNNYNEILRVFSAIDSSTIQSEKSQLQDCIRKASIAIQRHPNSKWVDDCYILIGKARYYTGDFINAIETFKYVNTTSENDNARHEALIMLMRVFIDHNEDNNAMAVSDYLNKEKLNFENRKKLSLTRAYFNEKFEDYDNVVKYLVESAPYLRKKENADRIHFIIAQIYQLKGFDAEAYNYYSECLSVNPTFELAFYTKLNMAEVTQLSEEQDVRKVRKYFRTLLRDRKNSEFRDKIYYEMGNFEKKQNNTDESIEYYKLSVQSNVNNPRQKAYSYLKLGEIYFEEFKNYELAKSYYDSVVSVLPRDDEIYPDVSVRQEVLADFVTQINTIHNQDSLLKLAEMDTSSINRIIEAEIESRRLKAEAESNRLKNNKSDNISVQTNVFQTFNETRMPGDLSGATWYFYNVNASGIGQNEFRRIWGERKLEDHWRRSNKESASQFNESTDIAEPGLTEDAQTSMQQGSGQAQSEKGKMLATIPFTPEAKKESLARIEQAYYNLGNIYNFKLNEKAESAGAFETLLERFPETINEAEVRYLLYLIYGEVEQNDKRQFHSDMLLARFPNSIFSKLILNPNYREESNLASERLKSIYEEAYRWYETDSLMLAFNLVKEGESAYPDNDFSDNLKLLEILISGKRDGIYKYQFELQEFKKKYPDSELLGYIDTLLISSEEFQKAEMLRKEIQFMQYYDQVHYFVIIYPGKTRLADELPLAIDAFNKNFYSGLQLKIGNLLFDNENSMIIVNEFNLVNDAMDYFKKFNENVTSLNVSPSLKSYNFVISKDNFQVLYQTKGFIEYLEFFRKNY